MPCFEESERLWATIFIYSDDSFVFVQRLGRQEGTLLRVIRSGGIGRGSVALVVIATVALFAGVAVGITLRRFLPREHWNAIRRTLHSSADVSCLRHGLRGVDDALWDRCVRKLVDCSLIDRGVREGWAH